MATMPSGSGHGWYEAGSWEFGVRLSVPAWFVSVPPATTAVRLGFTSTAADTFEALEVRIERGDTAPVDADRWLVEVSHLGAEVWRYGIVWRSAPTP
jgi:hypothetical protein